MKGREHDLINNPPVHQPTCQAVLPRGYPSQCHCNTDNLAIVALGPREKLDEEVGETGKWIIFPNGGDLDTIDQAWDEIRRYTIEGRLGFVSKISLIDRNRPAIMAYCAIRNKDRIKDDFIQALRTANCLGPVRFKEDEATRLGLYSRMRGGGGGGSLFPRPTRGGNGGGGHVGRGFTPVSTDVAFVTAPTICRNWEKDGKCSYGDRCKFLHEDKNAVEIGGKLDPRLQRSECIVCMEQKASAEGIICEFKHFVCKECVKGTFKNTVIDSSDFFVPCPGFDDKGEQCHSRWNKDNITSVVPAKVITDTLIEQLANVDRMLKMKDRDIEKEKEDNTEKDKKIKAIIDKIRIDLNPKCPRCNTVFVDYDGCDAVQCLQKGCGANFCGLCLLECDNDQKAHAHVTLEHGQLYSSQEVKDIEHKKRACVIIQKALDGVRNDINGDELVRELLNNLEVDMRDLRITEREVNINKNVVLHGARGGIQQPNQQQILMRMAPGGGVVRMAPNPHDLVRRLAPGGGVVQNPHDRVRLAPGGGVVQNPPHELIRRIQDWQCQTCTFFNMNGTEDCEMCGLPDRV